MKHIMVDLETLGTVPGCTILSIGAVFFDKDQGLGEEFYRVISRVDCALIGLEEDPSTINWWDRQSAEARTVLIEAALDGQSSMGQVLTDFTAYIKRDTKVKVWGNGADFDNAILAVAYRAVNQRQGWTAYNGRCYRTVKNLLPGPELVRSGTYHNALDDAKTQALHLIGIMQANPHADWS